MSGEQTLAETVKKARQCIASLTGLELTTIEGVYLRQYCEEVQRLAGMSSAPHDMINPAIEAAHRFLRKQYGLYKEEIDFIDILCDGNSEGFAWYFRKLQESLHLP